MCRYDKKIVYFDLVENEEKIGNAGFAKVIWQNGQMRLITNISGLHNATSSGCELFVLQGEREITLDSVFIKEGQCVYSRLYTGEELKGLGVSWEEAYGFCVNLGAGKKLEALWAEKEKVTHAAEGLIEKAASEEESAEVQAEELKEQEETQPAEMQSEELEEQERTQAEELEEQEETQPEEMDEQEEFSADNQLNAQTEECACLWMKGVERIHDDKWRQLEQVFSHVHPFGDKREYLSVEPKDYIVLTREYQKLANNSFLLHGYYNYRHTILGKISDRQSGQEKFYLGVPGVFYEREKAVALMFGFESFECAVEPAETGTFGYYMKRVEI